MLSGTWIKCADELPPDGVPVLVYGLADHIYETEAGTARQHEPRPMMAVYSWSKQWDDGQWGSVGDCGNEHEDSISSPTHWMALPAPPPHT